MLSASARTSGSIEKGMALSSWGRQVLLQAANQSYNKTLRRAYPDSQLRGKATSIRREFDLSFLLRNGNC